MDNILLSHLWICIYIYHSIPTIFLVYLSINPVYGPSLPGPTAPELPAGHRETPS